LSGEPVAGIITFIQLAVPAPRHEFVYAGSLRRLPGFPAAKSAISGGRLPHGRPPLAFMIRHGLP